MEAQVYKVLAVLVLPSATEKPGNDVLPSATEKPGNDFSWRCKRELLRIKKRIQSIGLLSL